MLASSAPPPRSEVRPPQHSLCTCAAAAPWNTHRRHNLASLEHLAYNALDTGTADGAGAQAARLGELLRAGPAEALMAARCQDVRDVLDHADDANRHRNRQSVDNGQPKWRLLRRLWLRIDAPRWLPHASAPSCM